MNMNWLNDKKKLHFHLLLLSFVIFIHSVEKLIFITLRIDKTRLHLNAGNGYALAV